MPVLFRAYLKGLAVDLHQVDLGNDCQLVTNGCEIAITLYFRVASFLGRGAGYV